MITILTLLLSRAVYLMRIFSFPRPPLPFRIPEQEPKIAFSLRAPVLGRKRTRVVSTATEVISKGEVIPRRDKVFRISDVIKLFMENACAWSIDLNSKDASGATGFSYACSEGHSDLVEIFMDNACAFSIDLNSKDEDGKTGFNYARHSNVLKIFMEYGFSESGFL